MEQLTNTMEWRAASMMTHQDLLKNGVQLPRKIVKQIEEAQKRANRQLGLIVRHTGTSVRVTLCDLSLITDYEVIPETAQLCDATISIERNHRPGAHPPEFRAQAA